MTYNVFSGTLNPTHSLTAVPVAVRWIHKRTTEMYFKKQRRNIRQGSNRLQTCMKRNNTVQRDPINELFNN